MTKATPTPTGKKIAIVGFTASNKDAPWGNPEWEIWICNNLWKFCPDKWHRLYDLHKTGDIESDKEHAAFLSGASSKRQTGEAISLGERPVYAFEPKPEWKTAKTFPKSEITGKLGRYFTNSISWMIAHALMEGVTDLHVYGVDMATGGEYSGQRPSCEYLLGIAVGMGVNVFVPESSDLLKSAALYGAEDDSPLAAKINEREKELVQRSNQLSQQLEQTKLGLAQLQGALETTRYFKDVWVNPRATSRHQETSDAS